MSSTKKSNLWVIIVTVVCWGIFLLPAIIGWVSKDNKEETVEQEQEQVYVLLDIYETKVEFQPDAMCLNLVKGTIKTNQQVDKIFINANGIGTQYVDFNASLIRTEDSSYIAHAIEPVDCLCATMFASDATITVDVYVEYAGRSYKVDTQKVSVKSCWTDFY